MLKLLVKPKHFSASKLLTEKILLQYRLVNRNKFIWLLLSMTGLAFIRCRELFSKADMHQIFNYIKILFLYKKDFIRLTFILGKLWFSTIFDQVHNTYTNLAIFYFVAARKTNYLIKVNTIPAGKFAPK